MHRTILLIAAAMIAGAKPGHAQQASQHGVVAQTVNETVITLEYDRPVARGRELFGELVECSHFETLGYYFPVVGPYEATLAMHWGTTVVPLQIAVER